LGEAHGVQQGLTFPQRDGQCAIEDVAGCCCIHRLDPEAGNHSRQVPGGNECAPRPQGDDDGLRAAFQESVGGLRRRGRIAYPNAGQQFGFGFVRGEDGDLPQQRVRKPAGGGRIKNHAHAGFRSQAGRGEDRLHGGFKLHQQNARPTEGGFCPADIGG